MSTEPAPDFFASLVSKEQADRKAAGWSKDPLPPKPPPPPIIPATIQARGAVERVERATKHAQLGEIIVNRFLSDGKDHTIPELAKVTTFPLAEIKSLLSELPKGVQVTTRGRKHYYGPSREHLRELLIRTELAVRVLARKR